MTISLCMIVKNEENNLGNCLSSVEGLFDEINIVDTGSTDRTVEIAQKYTERIFHFDWINDFSAARNFSFSKATKEYIIWLDADDIIDKENYDKFMEFKRNFKNDADCIIMPYIIDTQDNGKPSLVSQRERIVRNNKNFYWTRPIHENLKGQGTVSHFEVFITHTKKQTDAFIGRNISILEKAVNSSDCEPIDNYYYGVLLNGTGRHAEAVEQLSLFINNNKNRRLTGIDAFIAIYNSYIALGDYENAYKVLALNEEVNKDKSEYYCLMGFFMMNYLQDYDKAEGIFKKALDCTGKEADMINCLQRYEQYYYFKPWNFLGQCYVKKKEYKNACDAFSEALKYDEDNEELKELINKLNEVLAKIDI